MKYIVQFSPISSDLFSFISLISSQKRTHTFHVSTHTSGHSLDATPEGLACGVWLFREVGVVVRAATPDWVYLCGPRAAQHILPIPIEQYDIMYAYV